MLSLPKKERASPFSYPYNFTFIIYKSYPYVGFKDIIILFLNNDSLWEQGSYIYIKIKDNLNTILLEFTCEGFTNAKTILKQPWN